MHGRQQTLAVLCATNQIIDKNKAIFSQRSHHNQNKFEQYIQSGSRTVIRGAPSTTRFGKMHAFVRDDTFERIDVVRAGCGGEGVHAAHHGVTAISDHCANNLIAVRLHLKLIPTTTNMLSAWSQLSKQVDRSARQHEQTCSITQ